MACSGVNFTFYLYYLYPVTVGCFVGSVKSCLKWSKVVIQAYVCVCVCVWGGGGELECKRNKIAVMLKLSECWRAVSYSVRTVYGNDRLSTKPAFLWLIWTAFLLGYVWSDSLRRAFMLKYLLRTGLRYHEYQASLEAAATIPARSAGFFVSDWLSPGVSLMCVSCSFLGNASRCIALCI